MLPNVLLLVLDTARADAFEPWGAPAGSSPVIEDIAAAGGHTRFAYAPGSWTVPSHAGMLSGRLPRAHGLCRASQGAAKSVRPGIASLEEAWLPTIMRDWGYRTLGVSCNAWVSGVGGWDTGFERFRHIPSRRNRLQLREPVASLRWLRDAVLAEVDDGAAEAMGTIGEWLDDWNAEDPFFLFVNLVECHSPYLPPKPWNDLGFVDRIRSAMDAHRHQSLVGVFRHSVGDLAVPPSSLERMRHLYAQAIRLLDDWVDRLMQQLEERGILDDTIVVITSDHGENFGEGGLLGHVLSLDERLIRVPFVTHGPLDPPADGPWSLLGLPALLAEAIGRKGPWAHFEPGRVAPAQHDRMADLDDPVLQSFVRDHDVDEAGARLLSEDLTCVVDGSAKLVQQGGERFWHDLTRDPLELERLDIADCPAHLVEALSDPDLWRESPATPPAASDDTSDPAFLEEQMRLLGYL